MYWIEKAPIVYQTCNEFAAQQVVVILSNENFWFVRKFASRYVADQISG